MHVTCVTHGLHRVAEETTKYFSQVDRLISNGKKIFFKTVSRVQILKKIVPIIILPSQPVLDRGHG